MSIFKKFFKRKNMGAESNFLIGDASNNDMKSLFINKISLQTLSPDAYKGIAFLIVDDNMDQLDITTQFLKKYGASVDFASNGQEGLLLYLAQPNKYHMIFMDIQMPVMNGEEAARAIRLSETPKAKTIPIVVLSGNHFPLKGEAPVFTFFLAKPFELEQLAGTIKVLLNKCN